MMDGQVIFIIGFTIMNFALWYYTNEAQKSCVRIWQSCIKSLEENVQIDKSLGTKIKEYNEIVEKYNKSMEEWKDFVNSKFPKEATEQTLKKIKDKSN